MSLPKYPKFLPSAIAQSGDRADIPLLASSGELSYNSGFPSITQTPLAAGGIPPRRVDFNGIFHELSQHTFYQQSGGMYAWSEEFDYPLNALVYGSDNKIYKCIQANGISYEEGVKDPTIHTSYWKNFEDNPLLYPGAFVSLYEQEPPERFVVRNGSLIYHASTTAPLLYEALQNEENAWKLKTEAQWQAMREADPWNGVGGVPYFVLNIAANTIRLPDTRGMYEEGAGFDGLTVGGVHGDMIRNITGSVKREIYPTDGTIELSGAFASLGQGSPQRVSSSVISTGSGVDEWGLNSSIQVPTGKANKPRAYGVLHCVYLG